MTYSYTTTHGSKTGHGTSVPGFGNRDITLPGLDIGFYERDSRTAKFDLAFFLSETGPGNGLEGEIEFSTDLFDRVSVERLVGLFVVLLEGVVGDVGVGVHRWVFWMVWVGGSWCCSVGVVVLLVVGLLVCMSCLSGGWWSVGMRWRWCVVGWGELWGVGWLG